MQEPQKGGNILQELVASAVEFTGQAKTEAQIQLLTILLLLNDDTVLYNITDDVLLRYLIVLNKCCLVLFMQAQAERLIIEGQSAIECTQGN